MGITFAIIYVIGFLVMMSVTRARAGLGQGRIHIFGPGGVGLEWFSIMLVTLMFWPIALVIWLARGRPEPRIVFNEKARQRQRATRT